MPLTEEQKRIQREKTRAKNEDLKKRAERGEGEAIRKLEEAKQKRREVYQNRSQEKKNEYIANARAKREKEREIDPEGVKKKNARNYQRRKPKAQKYAREHAAEKLKDPEERAKKQVRDREQHQKHKSRHNERQQVYRKTQRSQAVEGDEKSLQLHLNYEIGKKWSDVQKWQHLTPVEISQEEYRSICLQPCHYCGRTTNPKGGYFCNGVDRINNAIGYLPGNCVPACFPCNNAKKNGTTEEFFAHMLRICQHQLQESNSTVHPPRTLNKTLLRTRIRDVRRGAEMTGRMFALTDDEIHHFIVQDCGYCGIAPNPSHGIDRYSILYHVLT